MKMTYRELVDLGEGYELVYDNIIDNSRWEIGHEVVFKHDGKFYMGYYRRGATENQDTDWDSDAEVREVEPVETKTTVYRRKS